MYLEPKVAIKTPLTTEVDCAASSGTDDTANDMISPWNFISMTSCRLDTVRYGEISMFFSHSSHSSHPISFNDDSPKIGSLILQGSWDPSDESSPSLPPPHRASIHGLGTVEIIYGKSHQGIP